MIEALEVLLLISALDLIINFFFHLVQFKRYCDNEVRSAINSLIHRVDSVECAVVESQRNVQTELHRFEHDLNDELKEDDGDELKEERDKGLN